MLEWDPRLAVVSVILGAGASRAVIYGPGFRRMGTSQWPSTMPSPLDNDFFDLLQRLTAQTQHDVNVDGRIKEALKNVVEAALKRPGDSLWKSMEKMFYSLHINAVLRDKLFPGEFIGDPARKLVHDFVLCIRALFNEAHGKPEKAPANIRANAGNRCCDYHQRLLESLHERDAILTFNYDFVAEVALAEMHRNKPFGKWFYGFADRPVDAPADIPTMYKLHGSLNWEFKEQDGEIDDVKNWPQDWNTFGKELDYLAISRSERPILLPYWDKRIEKEPWLSVWRKAADQLRKTQSLIIWGYSLPTTDLKAKELLRLSLLEETSKLKKVAVIDPSRETQDRWRSLFIGQEFWRFADFDDFREFLSQWEGDIHHSLGPLGLV